MKLKCAQVREFRSIWDSDPFEVDRVACFVGKNESGKTALLHALHRLNPIDDDRPNGFDVTDDYPRSHVEEYEQALEGGQREPAVVVEATFALEAPELHAVAAEYGSGVIKESSIRVWKGYPREPATKNEPSVEVPIVESVLVSHLVQNCELPATVKIADHTTLSSLADQLEALKAENDQAIAAADEQVAAPKNEAEKAVAIEHAERLRVADGQVAALYERVNALLAHEDIGSHIWSTLLRPYLPKFLYFDEYYQMTGQDNIEALKQRQQAKQLKPSDYPLLGLIARARLNLDKLLNPNRTQTLKNKLQGASNYLTKQIMKYWSQNTHLQMQFDVRQGLPGDPEGMQTGTNIWGEVFDAVRQASTSLGTRSAGFVWFFSFLAWYAAEKNRDMSLVLLLDEPGLSLHGKAQADLLRYFESEIVTNPRHQLLYTTHSPFMVDAQHFDRVRIVQDRGIDTDKSLPRDEDGTKVFTDVLEAGPDSLFPLQGALGYEIHQSLFIGPNSLIVEGASDFLYLQTLSGVLDSQNRVGLDGRWTITPVGGADRVPAFAALIGAQKELNVATLIDFQKSHRQMIENLYKRKLLRQSHVLTFADFTGQDEADIEDMFDENFYLALVNEEYSENLAQRVTSNDLTSATSRIVRRLGDYFAKRPLTGGVKFNHYRPARRLVEEATRNSIPATTLDRFERAFEMVNALLPR